MLAREAKRAEREERGRRVKLTLAMMASSLVLAVIIVWTIVERATHTKRGDVKGPKLPGGKFDTPEIVEVVSKMTGHGHGFVASKLGEAAASHQRHKTSGGMLNAEPGGVGRIPKNVLEGVSAELISGGAVDLATSYDGYVLLIVNVASKCGFTKTNYQQLEPLYQKFKEKKFAVLAFPCNQFGKQEPGEPQEIMHFVRREQHSTFPLFAKVDVNGAKAHPLYRRLRAVLNVTEIEWNFGKFLIGRDGVPLHYYDHTYPFPELQRHVEAVIEQ